MLALNGTFIEVLDTWQNVGPILDAVLTDIDGNGQVILVPPMVLILAETICIAAYSNGLRRHEHWEPTCYPEWCTFQNRCCHREHGGFQQDMADTIPLSRLVCDFPVF